MPRKFAGKELKKLIFHHPDGRMAKIKLRDFGLRRQRADDRGQGGA